MDEPREYRRNLPHIQPEEGIFFITFRLKDSLPLSVIDRLKKNALRREIDIISSKGDFNKIDKENKHFEDFIEFDAYLDRATFGTTYLKDPKAATIVANTIHYLDGKDFKLICYCIMPNHVHLIIYKTKRILFRILQSLKRHSAREANIILSRNGSFWQKESYDRLIRDRNDLAEKIEYTLYNPVKAGLVDDWRDWQFTYCKDEFLEY
ncbi:unnamed protein product [marine sediment metagenome]|uniref:Transposase IS200-like domain-containing protein n=1 Tax=marine sediment metagenome TaxID=412755 RepID=X1UAK4_9ZZZZ